MIAAAGQDFDASVLAAAHGHEHAAPSVEQSPVRVVVVRREVDDPRRRRELVRKLRALLDKPTPPTTDGGPTNGTAPATRS